MFVGGIATGVGDPHPSCADGNCDPFAFSAEDIEVLRDLGLSLGLVTGPVEALFVVANLVYLVIAGLIFWRRSSDWMAMLVSLTLVVLVAVVFTDANDALQRSYPASSWLIAAMMVFGITAFSLLLFLFPDGQFVPRWTRLATVAIGALVLLTFLPMPSAVESVATPTAMMAILGAGVYARIYRYRRVSSSLQRQQTKWVAFGMMGAGGVLTLSLVAFAAFPVEQPSPGRVYFLLAVTPILVFFVLLFPVSVAVAILRHRLWGIDLLINRTVVYGPLTGILMGLYIASIRLFQTLFVRFIGEESNVAILLSTLVLAGTFMPLRLRLQNLADRYFKEVPDPTRGLRAFGDQLQSMVQLANVGRMTRRLLDEVVAAFHAESGAVFMQQGEELRLVQTSGAWSGDAMMSVPLEYEGEQLGLVSLGSRRHEQDYTPQDRDALQKIAQAVAQTLSLSGGAK